MKRVTIAFFLVFTLIASTFTIAHAKKEYTTSFNSRYGTSGTEGGSSLGSCITCHNQTNGKGGENGYGTAYKNSGRNFVTIEPLDSDGDSFSNIEEISGGYFPGDPSSKPISASPPVADAGPDQTVDEGVTVTLDGSNSSDPDNDISSYQWAQTGGTPIVLSDSSSSRPTFNAPDVGPGGDALTFQLTVTDSGGLQSTDNCIVNVTWINLPPTADSGPDQTVNAGVTVSLNGANSSDPDNDITTYQWTQTGGIAVALSNSTAVQPTFTAPNVGPSGASLTFQLTVTDSGGLQSSDTCIVTVSSVNLPPVADAGPDQMVSEGDVVTLDGSNSIDPDGTIATYLWTQTGGPSVVLSDPSASQPTFTAPVVGFGGVALSFTLRVTDVPGLQASDTCIVNIINGNVPPTANGGPDQTVDEGVTVTLDGSNSSDPDDGMASYQWVQTNGPPVNLSSTTAVQPTFTAPDVGPSGASLTFQLTVTDNAGLQSNDTCIVTVSWVNLPPISDAGPDQSANEGDSVTLDGSNSSDPDDGIASYQWTQLGGTPVTLSNTTVFRPSFTAPNVGPGGASLTFQLTVTDNNGLQSTDTCIVNVSWINLSPTADAGPNQTVAEGDTVTLDGSGSTDPDDTIVSYQWTQLGGTSVTLSDPSAPITTFTAPNVGMSGQSLTFQLTVTDGGGLKSTATCIANVTWVNEAPVTDAGPDQTKEEGDTVLLDGFNSSDPDDGIASYLWTQTAGPSVTLSDAGAVQPTFVAPIADPSGAVLTFRLTVKDVGGLQSSGQVSVTVNDNGITGFPADVLTTRTLNGEPFGIRENNGGAFTRLSFIDPSTVPASAGKPADLLYGLVEMEIRVSGPGDTTTVTIFLPSAAPDGYGWYKYTAASGWTDYNGNAAFNPTRDQVTLTLTDGGTGDDDRVANGLIVDPSGLGTSSSASSGSTSTSSGDWGGGGCFIVTAAYHSSVEPQLLGWVRGHVVILNCTILLLASLGVVLLIFHIRKKDILRRR